MTIQQHNELVEQLDEINGQLAALNTQIMGKVIVSPSTNVAEMIVGLKEVSGYNAKLAEKQNILAQFASH